MNVLTTSVGFALLTVGGCFLLIRGLRGRRVGDEPHCPKCDYSLVGLPSERCPECGVGVSSDEIVLGSRQRLWGRVVVGLLLLLPSGSGLGLTTYGWIEGVDWYPYYPTFMILRMARDDDDRAIAELTQRFTAGDVGNDRVSKLLPVALARQGAKPRTRTAWAWTDLLGAMDGARLLTRAQQERFYDQAVRVSIEIRPRVRQGEEVDFLCSYWIMGSPSLTCDVKVEGSELRIGSWTREFPMGPTENLSTQGGGGGLGGSIPTTQFEPGVYNVELPIRKSYLCGRDTDWERPSFVREVVLTEELEILPAAAQDTVKLIHDPTLTDDFMRAITIKVAAPRTGIPEPGPGRINIEFTVDGPIPMDGAFQLVGIVGDRELPMCTFTVKGTRSASRREQRTAYIGVLEREYILPVLRTSVEAAKDTTDMFEIWDGELRFEPIRITTPAPEHETDE